LLGVRREVKGVAIASLRGIPLVDWIVPPMQLALPEEMALLSISSGSEGRESRMTFILDVWVVVNSWLMLEEVIGESTAAFFLLIHMFYKHFMEP
jgi:hypothetical protein